VTSPTAARLTSKKHPLNRWAINRSIEMTDGDRATLLALELLRRQVGGLPAPLHTNRGD
jgi:hypothetical protein